MAANELAIIEALVAELRTLTGLHPFIAPEPEMPPPFVFPLFDQDLAIDWNASDGPITGELMVGTDWTVGVTSAGARTLFDYTNAAGAKSIVAKLNGNKLGGLVRGIHVQQRTRWEVHRFPDGRMYLARPLRLKIYP